MKVVREEALEARFNPDEADTIRATDESRLQRLGLFEAMDPGTLS
jgi:hypothetical protein